MRAFTLIELMICIAIIAILSSFAIPSYTQYLRKARFSQVIAATEPFKIAVALAIQDGLPLTELNSGAAGIPDSPPASDILTAIHVHQGIITAIASERLSKHSYISTPNRHGTDWVISGSCIKAKLCDNTH